MVMPGPTVVDLASYRGDAKSQHFKCWVLPWSCGGSTMVTPGPTMVMLLGDMSLIPISKYRIQISNLYSI